MRKILIALGLFLVLAVVGALVAPSFIDWNAYRTEIAAAIEAETGRPVSIEGELDLEILWAPAFRAAKVRLGNAEGGSEPDMLSLEGVSVEVALLPLLAGGIQVRSIVFHRPVLLLERLPDGRGNWDLGSGPLPDFSLASLVIDDGTLIWREPGREERLEAVKAEIAADTANGPFRIKGQGKRNGLDLTFEAVTGNLAATQGTSVDLRLGLPGAEANARLQGRLRRSDESFSGQLTVSGEDLSRLAAALPAGRPLPQLLAQPFELSAEIAADPTRLAAGPLRFVLGAAQGSGDAVLTLEPALDLQVALALPLLDLDALQAAALPQPEPEEPAAETATPPPVPLDRLLPAGSSGRVELAVELLRFRGQSVRQLRLGATLADDAIVLDGTQVRLPGGAELQLSGAVALREGIPTFGGDLRLQADNLRALLDWLGYSLPEVPSNRLRRAQLSARLEAMRDQATLADLEAELDASRASGGLTVALGARPGFGLRLAVDKLNLDAYLPQPLEDEVALPSMNANLDLSVGSLTYRDTVAEDLALQGSVAGGVVMLKEARIGRIAGGSIAYRGRIALPRDAQPLELEGEIELAAAEPGRLARLAGLEPATLAPLGSFSLTGSLKGAVQAIEVNLRLAALGGEATAVGRLGPLPIELVVTLRHPSLAALAASLAGSLRLPDSAGALDVAGRLAWRPDGVALTELKGQLGRGPLERGSVAVTGLPGRANLAIDLAGGEIDLGASDLPDQAWMQEPLGIEGLRGFDATLHLTAARLRVGALQLDDPALAASLAGGVLTLERVTASLPPGRVEATGLLDARETPRAALELRVEGASLAAFVPLLEGGFDLSASLGSEGSTPAVLLRRLSGGLEAEGRVSLPPAVASALAAGSWGGLAAPLPAGWAEQPIPVSLVLSAEDGSVSLERVEASPSQFLVRASGTLDLLPLAGDLAFTVAPAAQPDQPLYRERRRGPLSAPEISRDLLGSTEAVPTAPREPAAPPPQDAPLPPVLPKLLDEVLGG